MNVAVFVTHELEIRNQNRNWLCADTKKAADVDNDQAARASTM